MRFYILVINTFNEYSPPPIIPDITKEQQDEYALKIAKRAVIGRKMLIAITIINLIFGIIEFSLYKSIIYGVISIILGTQIIRGYSVMRWIYCGLRFFISLIYFASAINYSAGFTAFISFFYLGSALLVAINKYIDAYYVYLRPKLRNN